MQTNNPENTIVSTAKTEIEFYRQVAQTESLFSIIDDKGIPTPTGDDGLKVMPFWSSEAAALDFIQSNEGFTQFQPYPIEWSIFQDKWIEGIAQDDLLVGLNWQKIDGENCVTEVELMLKGIIEMLKNKPIKKAK